MYPVTLTLKRGEQVLAYDLEGWLVLDQAGHQVSLSQVPFTSAWGPEPLKTLDQPLQVRLQGRGGHLDCEGWIAHATAAPLGLIGVRLEGDLRDIHAAMRVRWEE